MNVGSEKLLPEIKFDYLPKESPTKHGWTLREGSEENLLSREDPAYGCTLRIKAEQDLCLDYDLVGKLKQECKAVEFVVRSESRFSFHAVVRFRSQQQEEPPPDRARLRYDFNSDTEVRYPEPHTDYLEEDEVEYGMPVTVEQLMHGWTLMKIDLPKKVREIAVFEDKGWEFSELLTLRIKGSGVDIDVARIRFYSEYLNNVSTLPPGPIRNRWALLVGVNHYVDPAFPPLKFCVNDVLALERTLKALGYTIVALHDDTPEERLLPTRDNVEAELTRLCQVVGLDDLLLVHFACHGKLTDGQPVLITRETRAPTLARKALPLAEVERQMRKSLARRLVLTLNACHAGVEIGRDLADPEFIRNAYELAEGFALIAASTAQQVAQEWEKKEHGVFTYYLLEGLSGQADRTGKGFVTVDDLKTHVLDGLRRWNVEHGGLLQEPTARTEGLGDIILVDYRDRARPAGRPPIHLRTEGPETSTSSSERLRLIEFTFTPPEPHDYRNWFSAFRRITEEGRANGDWTDNNGAKHRFKHLDHFVKPFCNGQVYDASFALYSKDPDGNFYEHVEVIVKPKRALSFEVTDRTQAQRRDKLANIIRQEIGNLKGVRLISMVSLPELRRGNPFIVGLAIRDPARFYGRQAELRAIAGRVGAVSAQSISIVGERRIGKSSLLWQIKKQAETLFRTGHHYKVLFLDLSGAAGSSNRMLMRTLRRELTRAGLPAWEEADDGDLAALNYALEELEATA